ncbi:MAG TPA: glycosyltransferase [Puia sp.]|nr:glycosyltransferase [Puia sp.]
MRICIISKYIPPASTDGIPRGRWEYARQFRKLGHEVHMITTGAAYADRVEEGIFIHEIVGWNEKVFTTLFKGIDIPDSVKDLLCYSYLVFDRIRKLHKKSPLDILDSPLWDIEGYIAKLLLPEVPMVVRLETTSMLIREILTDATPQKDKLGDVETHFLQIADACVFDSWSILAETERLYKVDFGKKAHAVIHHGVDLTGIDRDIVHKSHSRPTGSVTKVITVGRLEKRKGSDILIKNILPGLLEKVPDIEIHIVGKDSGEWDGFKAQTGYTYYEYLHKHYAPYINKRIFVYGYVDDIKLAKMYEESDIVLALSRYESFGLLYVEAVKKGKPIIAFNTGAVSELLEPDKEAILIDIAQPEKVIDAIKKLKDNPSLRESIAKKALDKLFDKFDAGLMGVNCSSFFEELIYKISQTNVYQVMNCLSEKDGVSNITVDYDTLLRDGGFQTQLVGDWSSETWKDVQRSISSTEFKETDWLIYHYWNYCERGEYFNNLTLPKKVFLFHNITTPDFFESSDEGYANTTRGFDQLKSLDNYDVYAGLSEYSVDVLKNTLKRPITTFVLPPLIDRELLLNKPYNKSLVEKEKKKGRFNIIFVGSIAPHKKQTDLVNFFQFYRTINPGAHLVIVGGGSEKYTGKLKNLIRSLRLDNDITCTGKVDDEDLYAWYRVADIYLSMSEHEGFGVPLAEAMVFQIPVVAYNCTAVGETVGNNGCLFDRKDSETVSAIIEKLRKDATHRADILSKQNVQLEKYSSASVTKAFQRLYELTNKKHNERRMSMKSKPGYLVDEVVHYNDARFQKEGKFKFVDNLYLYPESTDGAIILEESFSEMRLSFLAHMWSGKVSIQVDKDPAELHDLFSVHRGSKTISITTPEDAPHRVVIKKTGLSNIAAKGEEVLLNNIILRKTTHKNNGGGNKYEWALQTAQTYGDLLLPVNPDQPAISEKRPRGFVVLDKEYLFNDPALKYTGNWEVRNNNLMFTHDYSGTTYIEAQLFFSELELLFIIHDWSGIVRVVVDDFYSQEFNLYHKTENRVASFTLNKIFPQKEHKVRIEHTGSSDHRSMNKEIIFHSLRCYWGEIISKTDEELKANYKVSVVINTLDRASHLEKLLRKLSDQTYPYFEVVVVNGPSKDGTQELLNKYKGKIKVAACPEANLSRSRNIGIDHSSGEYIAFIDDDAIPGDRYWIENYINFIIWKNDPSVGIMGGPVKHRDTENYEFKNGATSDYAEQIFRDDDMKGIVLDGKKWVRGVRGANNIILKRALVDIGGFDQKFIYYLDETDVCFQINRKGYSIINHSSNYVRHYSATGEFRKGPLDLKWDVITRSDTYFCLKTSNDFLIKKLIKISRNLKRRHFYKEIKDAWRNKGITSEEHKKYMGLIKKGFREGLKWGTLENKRINYLENPDTEFLPFNSK